MPWIELLSRFISIQSHISHLRTFFLFSFSQPIQIHPYLALMIHIEYQNYKGLHRQLISTRCTHSSLFHHTQLHPLNLNTFFSRAFYRCRESNCSRFFNLLPCLKIGVSSPPLLFFVRTEFRSNLKSLEIFTAHAHSHPRT